MDVKKKILIVEDREPIRMIYRIVLRDKYIIAEAENGQDALDYYLSGERFDLVILDLMMPVMSGEQFLLEIWQRGFNPRVIIATAKPIDDIQCLQCKSNRQIRFLIKPFDFKDIKLLVEEMLHA